jgi:hypothetical protein
VVGVVEHVHNHSLTKEVRGEIYSPFDQNKRDFYPQTVVVRTSGPPLSLVPIVRAALREQDRSLAMDKVQPMTDYVEREIAPANFTAVLAVIFVYSRCCSRPLAFRGAELSGFAPPPGNGYTNGCWRYQT